MVKILEKLKYEQTLCEIYFEDGSRRFSVGYITDCDEDFTLFEKISPDGRWDGFECRLTEDIKMLQTDTGLLRSLEKLMPFYNFNHKEIPLDGKTVLDGLLEYIRNGRKICRLESYRGCDLSGYILSIEEGVVEIAILDELGRSDGVGYILKEDIDYISVDSEDELRHAILSKNK